MYSILVALFVLFFYFFFGKKPEEPSKIGFHFGPSGSYSFYEDTGKVVDETS
jgi:hypothetical protein